MIEALLAATSTPTESVNIAPRLRLLLALIMAFVVVLNGQWIPLLGYGLLALHLWQRSAVGFVVA